MGVFTLVEGAARAVRQGDVVNPQPERTRAYDHAYAIYDQLYPALKDIFPLLDSI